ncbi:MAG: hypothetical protein JHC53_08930 [Thermoleophilia bacterium]|nr:hypothetical protein [Thermoleophilia bacterium]
MRTRPYDGGSRGTIPGVIATAAAVLAISVFLPWYTADVAPPFSPESSSGWDSSVLARGAFGMGVLLLMAALLILLDVRGTLPLDADVVRALSWLCMVLALAATALVAWRLVRPPGPAEFLARDVGLYIAQAAAIVALVGSIAIVRPRA